MPRVGGVYSVPTASRTDATASTTISSAPYKALLDDLEADLNAARPVTAGGTGATTAAAARTNLLGTTLNSFADNGAFALKGVTYLTSGTSATYTTPSDVRALRVTVVGAGGGGGGVSGPGSNGTSLAVSGAGGAWTVCFITSPAASYTYTVGAGGAGGSAGDNSGSAGGASSFTDGASLTLTANGGLGGSGNSGSTGTSAASSNQTPATATGGDLNVPGRVATPRSIVAGGPANPSCPGDTPWGQGGFIPATTGSGGRAGGYGAAGAGGCSLYGSASRSGGDGADGLIIVEEFY